jgi:hypothetical protein
VGGRPHQEIAKGRFIERPKTRVIGSSNLRGNDLAGSGRPDSIMACGNFPPSPRFPCGQLMPVTPMCTGPVHDGPGVQGALPHPMPHQNDPNLAPGPHHPPLSLSLSQAAAICRPRREGEKYPTTDRATHTVCDILTTIRPRMGRITTSEFKACRSAFWQALSSSTQPNSSAKGGASSCPSSKAPRQWPGEGSVACVGEN